MKMICSNAYPSSKVSPYHDEMMATKPKAPETDEDSGGFMEVRGKDDDDAAAAAETPQTVSTCTPGTVPYLKQVQTC